MHGLLLFSHPTLSGKRPRYVNIFCPLTHSLKRIRASLRRSVKFKLWPLRPLGRGSSSIPLYDITRCKLRILVLFGCCHLFCLKNVYQLRVPFPYLSCLFFFWYDDIHPSKNILKPYSHGAILSGSHGACLRELHPFRSLLLWVHPMSMISRSLRHVRYTGLRSAIHLLSLPFGCFRLTLAPLHSTTAHLFTFTVFLHFL